MSVTIGDKVRTAGQAAAPGSDGKNALSLGDKAYMVLGFFGSWARLVLWEDRNENDPMRHAWPADQLMKVEH